MHNYKKNKVLGTLFLLVTFCLTTHSTQTLARELAQANYDLAEKVVCFPVKLLSNNKNYNACLNLKSSTPTIQFGLKSFQLTFADPASIAQYDASEGLTVPLIKMSDDRNYADAKLDVSYNTSTREYTFTLKSIRRLKHNLTHSIARIWNEALLDSIRNDLARPTVHARNLFHTSAVMYDAWAAIDTGTAANYLLGNTLNGYECSFSDFPTPENADDAKKEAISYAAFNLLRHRFQNIPGKDKVFQIYDDLMLLLGYDKDFLGTDYSTGSAAALGNHIADCMIGYGLQDGANEANNYAAIHYVSINEPLFPGRSGNTTMSDPDRWQPLSFEEFIDQSGNVFTGATPPFVSPEWGKVKPFSLASTDLTVYQRGGQDWWVYHDPGMPSLLKEATQRADYQWNFELVSIWSSHLDPKDEVMWDISPAAIGNIADYPTTQQGMRNFYKLYTGGDTSRGYEVNPKTGQAYEPQLVPRADYARVLAEFWADGPDSETPPGHWFTIFNTVSEHPLLEKRFKGEGPVLSDLEWDIKGYFVMGGAMHDSAVTAWGIKGYYDTSRPVSAIRYMAEKGQRSDSTKPNYDPDGMSLMPGYIEQVAAGDPLAGTNGEHVGKIKLKSWKGPDFITDPALDEAGVGWILAENWWPYQRPTFVSPPFAGYISGHSTYSRAAAEVMTLLTGDAYFPGGMSEFLAPKNTFLVFEEGPSVDIVLQWATYRDASDQTSLSRIWGGIHPPMDDMPGRLIGEKIGPEAFNKAENYFQGSP